MWKTVDCFINGNNKMITPKFHFIKIMLKISTNIKFDQIRWLKKYIPYIFVKNDL